MTTVSIHQSAYFPWMVYFDRIRRSDVHVILDHVQFERGSFINRQKAKDGSWLTVPVTNKGGRICDVKIRGNDWKHRHLKTIKQQYGLDASPYISQDTSLADMLQWQYMALAGELGIETEHYSSFWQLPYETFGKKQDLVLNICKHFNADTYLSGPLGRNYLDMLAFQEAGIKVEFDDNPTDTRTVLEYLAEKK